MSDARIDRLRIDVHKRLGAFEFRADLDLPLSGVTAIFGPSGAGKSTLINLVAGLHRPDAGLVRVGATVFCDTAAGIRVPIERRELGVVFQDARLFPHLSVHGNLHYGLRRAGARAHGAPIAFEHVVELLGLAPLLARRPHALSGGEKQRVALGRALLAQPRLLLMDEPLASLDAARKSEILPYIERLRDEFGVPILYVSHALDEVLRLATALVLVERGQVVAHGELAAVLADPAARRLLGGAELGTLVFGRVASHDDRYALSTIRCDGFELHVPRVALPAGSELRARIPARDVALALARPSDVSILNRIEGVIERVTPKSEGPYADVSVRVGPATVLQSAVTRESADRLALAPGLRVWCLIKSVALDAGALALASGQAATRAYAGLPASNDASVQPPSSPPPGPAGLPR